MESLRPKMIQWLSTLRIVKGILTQFDKWYAEYVSREENAMADALSKIASSEIENYPRSFYFQEYYNDNNIKLCFTSVTHPQANRQAKVANRIILDGLKKRVQCSRNTWTDELPPIQWAYRPTCKVTTEATPFMLAYGTEVVVPVKITHRSPRVETYEPKINEEGMRLSLDLVDKVRDEANGRNIEHQWRASLYYNKRVKERFFQQGYLVLRNIKASGVEEKGNLTPNWEGPYKVKKY
ncbi:uncharacterized protein LOC141686180 [Apium graveolens]|uniref:uncharacterized protein LOC141686180 n=1 Tax=Apium graveolens TaxID=4045 RepID=UPI003D79CD26